MTKTKSRKLKARRSCPACGRFAQRPATAVACGHCDTVYIRPFIEDRHKLVIDSRRLVLWALLVIGASLGGAALLMWVW